MGKFTSLAELKKKAESFGLSYNEVVHSSHHAFYQLIYPLSTEEKEDLITVRRKGKNGVSFLLNVTYMQRTCIYFVQLSAKRTRERTINTLRGLRLEVEACTARLHEAQQENTNLRLQVEASTTRLHEAEQENARLRAELEFVQKEMKRLQESAAIVVSVSIGKVTFTKSHVTYI